MFLIITNRKQYHYRSPYTTTASPCVPAYIFRIPGTYLCLRLRLHLCLCLLARHPHPPLSRVSMLQQYYHTIHIRYLPRPATSSKVVRVPEPSSTSYFSFQGVSRGLINSHLSFHYPRDSRGLSHFRFQCPRDSRGLKSAFSILRTRGDLVPSGTSYVLQDAYWTYCLYFFTIKR